jgi:drug/metabolite transporter (DMT)-like permease
MLFANLETAEEASSGGNPRGPAASPDGSGSTQTVTAGTASFRRTMATRWTAYLPFAALVLLALAWGYNWVVMKVAMQYAEPFTFAALRTFVGAIFMFALVAALRRPLRPVAFGLTAVFGLLQTAAFVGLAMWAVHIGGAGKTSVLAYTMPFWLLLLAWPLLGEPVRGLQWASVVLAFGGLVFVLGPWNLSGLESSLLALGAGFCWAVSSVVVKVLRRRHQVDLLSLIAWQGLVGSIPLVVVALATATTTPVWSGSFIAALAFNVLPANALAWVLWLYILHSLPTGTAGISSLAVPVVGVMAAWIQLGEQPGPLEAVGMGLIVVALSILTVREVRLGRKSSPPQPSQSIVGTAPATGALEEGGNSS